MIFIFGEKITMWTAWFSNLFQTNNIVVPFEFIILIFLKNSFLWRFSWKRYFISGTCIWRCTLYVFVDAGWIVGIGYNVLINLNLFSCSPFFKNLPSKCLIHITAEEVGCQSFLMTNFILRFSISPSLENKSTGTISFPVWFEWHPTTQHILAMT